MDSSDKRSLLVSGVVLLILGIVLWAISPGMHGFWFAFYQGKGIFLAVLVVALGVGAFLLQNTAVRVVGGMVCAVGVVMLLSSLFIGSTVAKTELAQSIEAEEMSDLPDTTGIRYLPLQVAENCAVTRLRSSQYVLGDIDPIGTGSELDWVAPLEPNGTWPTWISNTKGVAVIKPSCSLDVKDQQPFKYGEGMQMTDNLNWQLHRERYWADVAETYYVEDDEEVLTVAPYIKYKLHFRFAFNFIPTLATVPYWGGVFVVDPDGEIEDFAPEEARNDSRLEGQRIYPSDLSRKIGEAWKYRLGMRNVWFVKEDLTEIPDVDGPNDMPYLLPTTDGPKWFTAFEPTGDTHGIAKMMFVDAITGQVNVYDPPSDSAWMGVNRAEQAVSNEPLVPWENYSVIEPRPVVEDGTLHWMNSVTNKKNTNVTFTTLTNTQNNNVKVFCTLDDLTDFIDGETQGLSPSEYSSQGCGGVVPTTDEDDSNETSSGEPVVVGDISEYSDEEIDQLLIQIAEENASRNDQ